LTESRRADERKWIGEAFCRGLKWKMGMESRRRVGSWCLRNSASEDAASRMTDSPWMWGVRRYVGCVALRKPIDTRKVESTQGYQCACDCDVTVRKQMGEWDQVCGHKTVLQKGNRRGADENRKGRLQGNDWRSDCRKLELMPVRNIRPRVLPCGVLYTSDGAGRWKGSSSFGARLS
jgi:hypothetical protein